MPSPAAFWDKHADRYAKSPIKDMPAYEQTLDHVRQYLKPTDVAVELGCGTGSTALLLADNVAAMTATDISKRMIDIAKGKLAGRPGNGLRFVQSDATAADLPAGAFDVVLAFNLLHLIPNIPAAVGHARRLLKPGGLFISKTPCLAEGNRLLRPLVWAMRKLGLAPHVTFATYAELQAHITDAGFEIVETGLYPATGNSRFIVARRLESH